MRTTVPPSSQGRPGAAGVLPLLRTLAGAAARVETWAAATDARRRTSRALAVLDRDAWDVTHDVRLPGIARVDHLAVGPSGVYVFASKAWQGLVTVDHKGATITPERDPGSAWTARGPHRALPPTASAVARALATASGRPVTAPRAVVVVWAPFPERVAVCAGISYVAGEHLVEWLADQPVRSQPAREWSPPQLHRPADPPLVASVRAVTS